MGTLDPVLRGLWTWGNIAALPPQTQARIEATTRENASAYRRPDGFAFPHRRHHLLVWHASRDSGEEWVLTVTAPAGTTTLT